MCTRPLPCSGGTSVNVCVNDQSSFPSAPWKTHGGEWSASGGVLRVTGGVGPKAAIEGLQTGDFQLDVEIRPEGDGAQAGIVFRADDLKEGVDAFRGYYAGLKAGGNLVTWGAIDPKWRSIAVRPVEVKANTWYHLRLRVAGSNTKLFLDDVPITDQTWPLFDGIEAEDAAQIRGRIRRLGAVAVVGEIGDLQGGARRRWRGVRLRSGPGGL